jgi:hypothetical protein
VRPPTIRVIDFSGGSEFHDALASTTSTIRAIAALGTYTNDDVWAAADPMAHVEFVSAHDEAVLAGALASEALVIHVASHMHGRGDGEPAFYRRDAELPVGEVAGWLHDRQRGVRAACVLADGCNAGTARFRKAVRDCLEAPVTYVASRRTVNEGESALFAAAFYGALLQRKGKGQDPWRRTADAAAAAGQAFQAATRQPCPFQTYPLQPSRAARQHFKGR